MDKNDINDERKWSRFVEKLHADTLQRRIEWQDITNHVERDNLDGPVFLAQILPEKYVVVYQYRYQYWTDEDQFFWETETAIELADAGGQCLWRLPGVRGRAALLDAVCYVVSDAEDTFNEYLGQDGT